MYGFSDPTIVMLFQELPDAEKCVNYVWRHFPNSIKPPPPHARRDDGTTHCSSCISVCICSDNSHHVSC